MAYVTVQAVSFFAILSRVRLIYRIIVNGEKIDVLASLVLSGCYGVSHPGDKDLKKRVS
jgi:hypothetical protein